jgi:hypothetical protein
MELLFPCLGLQLASLSQKTLLGGCLDIFGRLVKITEEIIQSTVNLYVDIDGDMHGRYFYLVNGFYSMLGLAAHHEEEERCNPDGRSCWLAHGLSSCLGNNDYCSLGFSRSL